MMQQCPCAHQPLFVPKSAPKITLFVFPSFFHFFILSFLHLFPYLSLNLASVFLPYLSVISSLNVRYLSDYLSNNYRTTIEQLTNKYRTYIEHEWELLPCISLAAPLLHWGYSPVILEMSPLHLHAFMKDAKGKTSDTMYVTITS